MNKKNSTLTYVTDLIHRYLLGQATDKEQRMLDQWSPDSDMLNQSVIDESVIESGTVKVWSNIINKIKKERRSIFHKWRQGVAAAVIVVGIGAGLFTTINHRDKIARNTEETHKTWTTDNAGRMTINLADGSVVNVNAGSRIEIDEKEFNKKKREIWLDGEAFFSVAKNPNKLFIVHTGDIQTIVRGTSFNVKAYSGLKDRVVSVREGRVEIVNNDDRLGILTADRQLKYNTENGLFQITNTDWQNAAGWIDGTLVLNEAGADELCLRLQQQFGVTVTIENNALSGKLLSGSFSKGNTLDEVLSTIATIHQIHYNITDNYVTIKP